MSLIRDIVWDAFCGALLACGVLRVLFAIDAAPVAGANGYSQAAGFLPSVFGEFYVTAQQYELLNALAAIVLLLAIGWAAARLADETFVRARG